eukprot:gene8637-biopygen7284
MTIDQTVSTNDATQQQIASMPPIVSSDDWTSAWENMLVKEKASTRARDALAAERRRMPWMAVEKDYEFEGPQGRVRLLDLFEGRRQLIVYRAFFEPGVYGWPDHACRGCSLGADQASDLTHLHARGVDEGGVAGVEVGEIRDLVGAAGAAAIASVGKWA